MSIVFYFLLLMMNLFFASSNIEHKHYEMLPFNIAGGVFSLIGIAILMARDLGRD
jgi:hypothetical protein